MRKAIVIVLALLLTINLFAQSKQEVIVKPSVNTELKVEVSSGEKSTKSLQLTTSFDFNIETEKLVMTLTYKSDVAQKFAGVWFPNENIGFIDIKKYFDRNERGVEVSTTMNKQVKNGFLKNDEIGPAINCKNATSDNVINFSKCFGNSKNDIDNQIFTIENGSIATIVFDVKNEADTVIVRLNNLIPITLSQTTSQYYKKYQLQYIAKAIEMVVILDRDGCAGSVKDIDYLDNMIGYYNKFNDYLTEISKTCSDKNAFTQIKEEVLNGYDKNMFDEYRKTQCHRLKTRMDSLDVIFDHIQYVECLDCDKYVGELDLTYRTLDTKYQYMLELTKIQPRTYDVIEKFEAAKRESNKYIKGLNLTKYSQNGCEGVARTLKNVNSKIRQIKGLIINRCDLSKSQAEELSDNIKEAIRVINNKTNQWNVTSDVDRKIEIQSEIRSTIVSIDEKLEAMHADCLEKYEDLNETVGIYNEAKKLCSRKGIIQ